MTTEFDVYLDCRQDEPPLPTIRTKKMLDVMQDGEVLKLVTRSEGTVKNIRTFVANNTFCSLLQESKEQEGYIFLIKKHCFLLEAHSQVPTYLLYNENIPEIVHW